MNKFTFIRLNYPGLFAIKESIWISFVEEDEKFAFLVNRNYKGLTIHDPNNEIISKGKNGPYEMKTAINSPRHPCLMLEPLSLNTTLSFSTFVEYDTSNSRTYAEKPYTELLLLINEQKVIKIETIIPYLNKLFTRYNTSQLSSTLLKPSTDYWDESIIIEECKFEHDATFDEITKSIIDWNLPMTPSSVFVGNSKYGILPPISQYFKNGIEMPEIPFKYADVFDLFASGIMQLNHFKNFKLAILESFVAVEVLVVRITEEIQKKKGVSSRKIKEFKLEIDLAYRMDVLLTLFFQFSKVEEKIIGDMTRARSIRNDIMHNNNNPDEKEIGNLINHIRTFLFMLIGKYESEYK